MENNKLQLFNNPEFGDVRGISINGEPWVVGKDVAVALGYHNPRDALHKHVDKEDKNTVAFRDGTSGNPNVTVINESGVYALIFGSKLEKARAFKHWVTSEVLPSIRKTGGYQMGREIPQDYPSALRALADECEKTQSLEAKIALDAPKVIFADSVEASDTTILVGELAKILKQNGVDMGQNRLFEWMRKNGYLIKRKGSDYNMPTQRSMEMGLFNLKETAITHSDGHISVSKTVKISGKGQQYFVNLFLGKNKLRVIEGKKDA